ncbi:membrane protein [[Clostridium] sordellii]|uniref:YitT family protein n=1 Tax=Paraclostridium sordellii TaxID=1505 RepID=UPI0005E244A4|nr:YitT family protein [Paeniclostridium sordellii]MDU2147747.1 YitT family protein [Paeniclostridium sordellii]CEN25356.1 membrane protein [[Clostridium] sordellii] [Paeniclostridium sordellii]CEN81635.1 membrane protein [[Clostridium] sordellii] [Paeniclostridium sordellii]CEN94143.1 membrane protein [[Clostridium] sordellii] [Paeniclostridium sordellii]CEN94832.1 membrane protein [[Clostridium] sordellii] [Paeniclostridium sordellii]
MARRRSVKQIILVLIGSLILSFGLYNFNYQNNITEGGVLGFLLLLKNIFDIKLSLANLIIDIALLLVGYKFFGKKFIKYSILATISFSLSYSFFESIGPIIPKFDNLVLGSIVAGLFVGLGSGLVVRAGGAAGGDDALALVISKTTSLKIGKIYMITDFFVLGLSLVYLSLSQIALSLIAVSVSGKVVDFVYSYKNKELAKV